MTYIITLFNKKKYISSVVNSLVKEGGGHPREYIFVDDGSTDGSIFILKNLIRKLPGKVKIISRRNMGASFSTNEAVDNASGNWIRLLDGDDVISYKSTFKMLSLAIKTKEEFVYGLIHRSKTIKHANNKRNYEIQSRFEGLKKFIRNCPANSSCILVSKKRYYEARGCDDRFVSPDQMLFLRLFDKGKGVFFKEYVASMPKVDPLNSLSSQIKRSRFESILALIRFCQESKCTNIKLKQLAFKRALSRANTYNKILNNNFFSSYFLMYLLSKFYFPKNYLSWMKISLKVFTGNKIEKPREWLTGAEKKIVFKKYITRL